MFIFDKRVNKYVRMPAPAKPIGSGKFAGTTRSHAKGTDIQHKFKARIGVNNIYHKWA